ncbi:GGDEF domain-containing protein [Bradyrhizobium sp. LHD-71]|uniref:GGDEF domain-containing protein n=1 Tax=Bradyrhizobium sp. LHD-71 TaxID=3072141 RepID=UPI00280FA810|nr:GGDEF domain-containing protein [Bradyrhizobium sp. LHD-71]MDQ8726099.1 GGDEF domain-containing protein [Bradyrhizobium sp. LHD-71]
MSLDISTLYLVASLVAVMLGGLLLFFWRQERIPALGWWSAAYILGGVTVAVTALAGTLIPPAAEVVLTMVGFVACGLVWNAARVFHGRATSWPGILAGAAVWAGVGFGLPGPSSLRVIIGTAIVAGYAAITANELWSERRKTLKSRWPAVAIPAMHGGVLMLPILLGDVLRSGGVLDVRSGWVAAFAIEIVLYAVGTVFIIFMLVSERAVKAHKTAASIDPLTGLFNRRGFAELTSRMIEREEAAGRPVTVLIFDIDHFKAVNDRFGHPAGDEILKLFANVLVHTLRITDIVGRVGGEEFAAMLPCSVEDAATAAERVRAVFANAGVQVDETPLATSVSIGVAGGPPGTGFSALLAAADTALYRAKRGGRNRVEIATEEPLSLDQQRLRAVQQPAKQPTVVHHFESLGV